MIALAVFAVTFLVLAALTWSRTRGHFGYTIDDTYIHMAMAKNLAEHAVWGITPFEFTSSSSSPFWTGFLAFVFTVVGARELVPLALNVVFVTILIWQLHVVLQRYGVRPAIATLALVAVVLFAPLAPLVWCGLEHPLHAVLTIASISVASAVISDAGRTGDGMTPDEKRLLFLAPLLVAVRFEGLFLVFVACLLLLYRRRGLYAVALGAVALLPVVAYGIVSKAKGWYFLPNTVVLKGSWPDFSVRDVLGFLAGYGREGAVGLRAMAAQPHVLVLVLGALASFLALRSRTRDLWDRVTVMLALFAAAAFLHMQLARTGHFHRYEAYLVVTGLFVLTLALHDRVPVWTALRPRTGAVHVWIMGVLLAALSVAPLATRAAEAHAQTPRAIGNIHEQQFQMGRFLKSFYEGRRVVANDIGAITWLADFHLLDVAGLANMETAEAKLGKFMHPETLEKIAADRGMEIGIAYETWLPGQELSPKWKRVGEWTIRDNVVCAESTVIFFAVEPAEAAPLAERLRAFAKSLPDSVSWKVF